MNHSCLQRVCSSSSTKLQLDSLPAHLNAFYSLSLCSQLVCGAAHGSTPANVCEQLSAATAGTAWLLMHQERGTCQWFGVLCRWTALL